MNWLDLLGFIVLGIALGTFGTIIGAGGGFLLVPVLLLLGWPHEQAAGTSLLMVAANAASGSLSYLRQKRVDLASGWRFAVATLPGALIGSLVVDQISGRVFNTLFGLLLLSLALYLFLRPERKRAAGTPGEPPPRPPGWRGWGWTVRNFVDARGEHWVYGYAQPWAILLSFGVGFMSSILGIGGGIIHVPALINLFNFPAHVATATSHFVLAITAAAGTAGHLVQGHVRILEGLLLGAGAIAGAQVGGAVSHRVNAVWITRALAVALTLVAIRLLLG
jgi:uncharacterized membrane protein YfcA